MIGRKDDGQIWFKSDQFLKNISKMQSFLVSKAWFSKKWKLYGVYQKPYNVQNHTYYSDFYELLGIFKSETEASVALGQCMTACGIKPIELESSNLY